MRPAKNTAAPVLAGTCRNVLNLNGGARLREAAPPDAAG
jgi:hypothetical protein